MKKITFLMVSFLMAAGIVNAQIVVTWYAEAGETKTFDAIEAENGYEIEWEEGEDPNSMISHTYYAAGEYTVTIYGEITRLWMCGDAGNATGATSLKATEEMPSLEILQIWTNEKLTDLDLSNFPNLKILNITLGHMETLDISNNPMLENIDIKMSQFIKTIIAENEYPNLRFVDINRTVLDACMVNYLFEKLPDLTDVEANEDEEGNAYPKGTIYMEGCEGDKYSDPSIILAKDWTIGNGGTGDGGDCTRVDEPEEPEDPDSITNDAVSGLNIYYNGANVVVEGADAGDVVYLYTITGALKASKVAANGAVEFDVNAGNVYIVKAGAHAQKVVSAK